MFFFSVFFFSLLGFGIPPPPLLVWDSKEKGWVVDFFFSRVPSLISSLLDYFFTGVHSNEDLILCVKLGVYMGFCVHRGF